MRTLAALVAVVCSVGVGEADAPISDITVGAYLSMTGANAQFGIATRDGIALAIEEHNAKTTGRKLKLDVLDDAGKQTEATTAVTRLIDNGAVAIVGEVASSLSLAGGAVAQKRGVPMVTPSSTNPDVTKVGDMITRTCFLDGTQAYAIAKFAKDTLRITKIAVLFDQANAYSTGVAEMFVTELGKVGGNVTTKLAYTAGALSFETQLKMIAASKPQAIFVPGYYTDVATIAVQARVLGITVPFLGTDGWDSEDITKLPVEGYFANHFALADPRPTTKAFVTAFRAKYKRDPDGLAALGYDAAGIVAAAITRARSHNGADVNAAIRSTKNYNGATGTITIDPKTGEAKKPVTIIKVSGGKATYATTVPPR